MKTGRWLSPVCLSLGAGVVIFTLPFWWAIGFAGVFCLYAACEAWLWYGAYERREHVRVFIQHELDTMPRRDESTRHDVLMASTRFPASWQPFIEREPAAPRRATVHAFIRRR